MGDNMILLRGPKGERYIPDNTEYRMLPGEYRVPVTGRRGGVPRESPLDIMARTNYIGAGDLVEAITTSTGFKRWWDKLHDGECQSCKKNQATLNYIKFQGPKWLSKFVKERLT